VFLDAFLPENGQKGLDLSTPQGREAVLSAVAKGEISRPAASAGATAPTMSAADRAWVQSKMTPHPIGVSMQPIKLTGARERIASKTYIRGTANQNAIYDQHCDKLRADPTWRLLELDCGHMVMIEMPERLVTILLES
jgi:hypothetical protein